MLSNVTAIIVVDLYFSLFFSFFIEGLLVSSIGPFVLTYPPSPTLPTLNKKKKKEEKENTHAHTYTCTHTSSKKSSNTWFGFWDSSYCCLHSLLNQRCWVFFFCFLFFNLLSLWGTFVLLYCIHFCFNSRWRRGLLFCIPKLTDQKKPTKTKKKHTQKIDKITANRKAAGAQIMLPW